eukprot:579749-Pleurochrysis_carterae.AAC.1
MPRLAAQCAACAQQDGHDASRCQPTAVALPGRHRVGPVLRARGTCVRRVVVAAEGQARRRPSGR